VLCASMIPSQPTPAKPPTRLTKLPAKRRPWAPVYEFAGTSVATRMAWTGSQRER
jgi:hypothetical protein